MYITLFEASFENARTSSGMNRQYIKRVKFP